MISTSSDASSKPTFNTAYIAILNISWTYIRQDKPSSIVANFKIRCCFTFLNFESVIIQLAQSREYLKGVGKNLSFHVDFDQV